MTSTATLPLEPYAERALRSLALLRCMASTDLHALAYGDVHRVTAYGWTEKLLRDGFVQHVGATGTRGSGYFLGRRGARATPLTASLSNTWRLRPSPATAFHLLQRSALWTHLTKDGWTVGNGPKARLALRRFMVDQQRETVAKTTGKAKETAEGVLRDLRAAPQLSPDAELRCTCGFACPPRAHRLCPDCTRPLTAVVMSLPAMCQCNAVLDLDHAPSLTRHEGHGGTRLLPPLPFDVASKDGDIRLLLVDNPRISITNQVDALPLRTLGQPRLSVIVRPSDDDSIYDATGRQWLQRGARLRLIHRLFEEDHLAGHFPYSTTATLVDFKPESQLRVVH